MLRTPRLVSYALACLAFWTAPLAAETLAAASRIEVAALATSPKEPVRAKNVFRGFSLSIEEWSVQQAEAPSRATFFGFSHFADFAAVAPRPPAVHVLFSLEIMNTAVIVRETGVEQRLTLPEPYNPYAEFRKDWDRETKWLDLGDVVNRYTINKPDIRLQISVHGSGGRLGAIVPLNVFGKLLEK